MQVNDITSVDPSVDYTQILPIQQKRTIAFINHFVMSTVSFLNSFSQSCESQLMEFEYKLQKVESSLLILESQLSSISHLDVDSVKPEVPKDLENPCNPKAEPSCTEKNELEEYKVITDPIYQKFFKMLQVGVPLLAVKQKMQSEGLDPTTLDACSSIK